MLTERIIGAFTFRRGVYAEVEKDTSFTTTAWLIVAVVAFLNQIGSQATSNVLSWLLGGILTLLSLPLMVLTFGLFKFVINAILLWITDAFISDFKINGLGTLLVAAVLITILDAVLHWLI